jgi:tetratricopeptide (TPR) repeat protein
MAADPSEHVAQAKLLIAERRYQDAVRALRRALVSKPDHVEARLLLGTALLALERYDEVRAEMLALSRKVPKDARAHRLLGEAFLRGGKLDKAVEALRRALELDPDDEPARELLAEAGEEVPSRSRTMERWFDPEQVATVQTEAPEFVEEVTGPHVVMPEFRNAPASIVVDAAFQRAIEESDSSDITIPPPIEQPTTKQRPATLLGVASPVAVPPAQPAPVRRPKATLLGMPSPVAAPSAAPAPKPAVPAPAPAFAPKPAAPAPAFAPKPAAPAPPARPAAAGPPAGPARRDGTEQLDLGEAVEVVSSASVGVRATDLRGASNDERPRPPPKRREVTEQLDLEQLEDVDSSSSVELDASELRENSTATAPRPQPAQRPAVPAPSVRPPPRVSAPPPAIAPPPALAPPPAAGPPRGFSPPTPSFPRPVAPAPAPAAPRELDPFPAPPDFDASFGQAPSRAAPRAPHGAPPPSTASAQGADSTNQDRTNVRPASHARRSRGLLPRIAIALLTVVVVLGLTTLGVRAWLAGRRADALAALISAAEADGRAATLEAALTALTAEQDDDPESVALLARLEATGVLEHGRNSTLANSLAARLEGDDASLPNALLARTYLLLARGESDGARRAATAIDADDALASEAARARALTALASGDLTRAIGEARVSAAAATGAPRPSALLATLLSRSGDAVSALSALDGIPGGSVSPAVRLARARVLLARHAPGDREAAATEAAEVLGPLATTATPLERAGAHLVQAELAVAGGDLTRAASEAREALPAPADEAFGLARADVLVTTGAARDARAVLATLPPISSNPRRRACVTASVALALNEVDAAEQAISQLGAGGEIDLLRGRIAETRGRTDDAKTFYERVPLEDAAMPAARTRLAAILLAGGRVRQASDALAPASERLPTDVDITLLTARIRLELRDLAGARAAVERALVGGARSPRLLAMKAEIELTGGDAEAAATTLRGALALAPTDAALQLALARALRRGGHPADARAAVNAALTLEPASAEALLVLAELSTDAGDVAAANAAIAQAEATGHAPPADLARARVRVLVATGVGAAGVAAAEAIAQASRDASLYVALGRLHAQAEQDDEASDAFAQAVRLEPRNAEAWVGKVWLALRRGDLSSAARGLEKAIELADAPSTSPELRARIETARGRLRFEGGNFGDARTRAEAALALDARCAEAQLLLANIAIEQGGDPVPALRAATAGIAPPAEAIGRLALRLPRGDEACAAARRYLDAAPRGYDAEAVREVADRCR